MDALLGFPLAAAMLASCLWIAYLAAARLIATAAPHARLAAAVLLAMWLQVTVFTALGRLHLFRIEVAAPLWLSSAALAHVRLGGGRGLTELGRDLDAARGAVAELVRSPLRTTGVVVAYLVVVTVFLKFVTGSLRNSQASVVLLTVGGMHVFFDGFIWKLRRAVVARSLQVEPSAA